MGEGQREEKAGHQQQEEEWRGRYACLHATHWARKPGLIPAHTHTSKEGGGSGANSGKRVLKDRGALKIKTLCTLRTKIALIFLLRNSLSRPILTPKAAASKEPSGQSSVADPTFAQDYKKPEADYKKDTRGSAKLLVLATFNEPHRGRRDYQLQSLHLRGLENLS